MQQLQFIATSPQQFREEIHQDFKSLLEDLKKSFEPKTPVELLSRKETATLLKINLSSLHGWTKKGLLQSYQISGKVYYKRSEVESALIEL
ncbi:helix-turn-helix domain-containing protein [Maribacter sp. 1_MG-2023]|uniref:helix-turn-helix domain-containing protein n=1 Tax=Maribacter sp. 1_MG-2023 TaxID=3062677 RepID=UPI0026E3D869|nr:helix-turn-helix domain-containing protein [Maribacter sp. 1_MG-2023]MDO6473602.1 helix-turn-helix domain-containing protein [Maribacter sp. 1_MG-2023]